uniref:PHD finger protein 12b n=1 Tax=Astatotilapia calliptera TaxID=8154 RepID=A0A3P8QSD1_ASTCA
TRALSLIWSRDGFLNPCLGFVCEYVQKREQKSEQTSGLPEKSSSKRSASPAMKLELNAGPLRLEGLPPGAGAAGPCLRVAQVQLLDRRTSSRLSKEQNDGEEAAEPEDEVQGAELESSTVSAPTPRLLKRPFQLLIAAAMERNPTQFQLPSELTCTTALPGSSKRRKKEELLGKPFRRPQHELDPNGLVPLPVKICFSCNRSCRLAPLIQCDHCPLLFHMDCLDPPLTALPAGKWMCPNHVEHLVLNQRSLSLSSRCQLFDQFQDRMSQHAVKLDFLRRVHRQNAPNRRTTHQGNKKTIKVPDAIKSQYQNPPPMLLPAGVRQLELVCSGIPDHQPTKHFTTEAEQQEWLQDVIALQCSIMRHLSIKQKASSTEWTSSPDPCSKACSTPSDSQGASLSKDSPSGLVLCKCTVTPCQNCRKPNGPLELVQPPRANGPVDCNSASDSCRYSDTTCFAFYLSNSSCALFSFIVNYQKLCFFWSFFYLISSICLFFFLSCPSDIKAAPALTDSLLPNTLPSITNLSSCMKDGKEEDGGDFQRLCVFVFLCTSIELDKLDTEMIKLLAHQRIQQLFAPKVPSTQPPPTTSQKKVQARAVFYPLTGRGAAVSMCYRTLHIGSGADMDVCLTNYGHCNYVSGKHACIFYDENTKHYELLNYSEHGTTVDNVLYSCDFSEKTSPCPPGGLVAKVQGIIRRSKKREEDEGANSMVGLLPVGGVMSSQRQGGAEPSCSCKASSSSLIGGSGAGWEGTALLHHGSYIKLGCLQFVFSITEFASKQPKEEQATTPAASCTSTTTSSSSVISTTLSTTANTSTPPPPSTATTSGFSNQDEADSETVPPHQVPVLRSNSVP